MGKNVNTVMLNKGGGREQKVDGADVECCCVCLVPFKGRLNYFTMLCLQRQKNSRATFSPNLLHQFIA